MLWCYIAVPLDFSRTVRLYCSFVTKELLLSSPKYAFWEEYTVSPICCFSQYLERIIQLVQVRGMSPRLFTSMLICLRFR